MSAVLGDDRESLFVLGMAVADDDSHQSPLIAQASPDRVLATLRHLADRLPQPSQERPGRARPPGRVEKNDGVRTFEPKFECFEVVTVRDPRIAREHATLRLPP